MEPVNGVEMTVDTDVDSTQDVKLLLVNENEGLLVRGSKDDDMLVR